jgi:hypothetical protein
LQLEARQHLSDDVPYQNFLVANDKTLGKEEEVSCCHLKRMGVDSRGGFEEDDVAEVPWSIQHNWAVPETVRVGNLYCPPYNSFSSFLTRRNARRSERQRQHGVGILRWTRHVVLTVSRCCCCWCCCRRRRDVVVVGAAVVVALLSSSSTFIFVLAVRNFFSFSRAHLHNMQYWFQCSLRCVVVASRFAYGTWY